MTLREILRPNKENGMTALKVDHNLQLLYNFIIYDFIRSEYRDFTREVVEIVKITYKFEWFVIICPNYQITTLLL